MDQTVDQPKKKISPFRNFIEFIREQGVVGLAVGFILGGAVSKIVTSLVTDVINPLISLLIGSDEGLRQTGFQIGQQKILWGSFVATLVDFVIIALVVYFGTRLIGIERLDRKKD